MSSINWWQKIAKALIASLITGVLVLSLVSCGGLPKLGSNLRAATKTVFPSANSSQKSSGNISEVSPPQVIQALGQVLERYQPQVAILTPQSDEVLQDNTVTVQMQVQDLPLFKNAELDMGPHLHVILDNQPYMAVYDLNQPLVLPDLPPGTHTLRVFASRPWHESFKNEGAYAQTTFHIFTKTQDNNPDSAQPLLTYSRPKGSYGAEPILLDFYLNNAPLHLVAQESSEDHIADWRIRCTINGNSFVSERWEPLYLQGFKPGKNWVQLEFIDEQGNSVKNIFNNTVRLITYEPNGQDTLSKLVRGELSVAEARGIVDMTPTLPEGIKSPAPEETPEVENKPESQPEATPQETTSPESPAVEPELKEPNQDGSKGEETISPLLSKQKSGGFFSRFRRREFDGDTNPLSTPLPTAKPSQGLPPTLPEIIDTPDHELVAPQVPPQLEPVLPPTSFQTTTPLEEKPMIEQLKDTNSQ